MQNTNQIQNRNKKTVTLAGALQGANMQKMLNDMIGEKKSEFVANLISLSEASPDLQKVQPQELVRVAMNATALNLSLNKNLGHAYVIPYNVKANQYRDAKTEAQFQIGYKGLIQLAIRSGQYKHINAVEVREGEMKRNKFTGSIEFKGEFPENEIIGYVAFFELLNGFQQSVYMSTEKLIAHADKYSQAFKADVYYQIQRGEIKQNEMWKYSSPWYKQFEEMANKTVLKKLLTTYGILSVEMQTALEKDQTNHVGDYMDNDKRYEIEPKVEEKISEPVKQQEQVNPQDFMQTNENEFGQPNF